VTSEQSVHERAMRFLCFRSESQKNQGAELPKQVGDYRLGEPLGHGTSGSVFEAIQLNLQRKVALKLISLPPADWHPSGQERLAREAQLLAAIRHPNLVEVYDSGFQQGYFWISMEFVEGQTLADVLQGKSDSAPKQHGPEWLAFTARILEQLASALAALHADGIIHRDIKPGNILIDEDGEAHLVDFGLAKRDQDPGLTETDQFVGTPRYASPQQARGEKLTPASDLFSLGAVAFEMLNGEVAFGGSTRTEVLEKVQFSDPKWIRRKQIPSDLCAIVEHCLEKKMKDGYGDGVELLRELQRYALGQPVHAHPIRSWQRLGRRIKRQPRRALSLLGIMMLLLVVGLLSEVVRSQQSSLSEFEIQSILDQARQDWHWGTANAFHQGLQPLLEDEENVPAGVHGLLGDYYLSEYHDEKALFHYELELAIQPDSQADQMGKALAAAAFDHSAPDPGQFADPFDVRTIWLAGLMRHVQGDSPHAVELFNSALALAVDSHPLLIARSGSYLRARNYSDALLDVQAAKETRPSNWLIPFRTAVCQRHLGDLPSAYSTLKGAVLKHTLEGELIFQYLSYWLDHIQPSVTEGSTALPAEVLGLPKDSEYSFICRSKWQSYRDNSQEAIAILEQGRLLHPNSFEIKSLLALELFNENRLEEIVPLAEDVLNCPRHGHKLAGLTSCKNLMESKLTHV
jgi:serine/threonine protein kinase